MDWPANAVTRSRCGRFGFALASDCSDPAFPQYVGLDVSLKETSIWVIDEAGKMCGAEAALCLRRGAIINGDDSLHQFAVGARQGREIEQVADETRSAVLEPRTAGEGVREAEASGCKVR